MNGRSVVRFASWTAEFTRADTAKVCDNGGPRR
jgi:hypothetical protein